VGFGRIAHGFASRWGAWVCSPDEAVLLLTGGTGEHPFFTRDLDIVLLIDFGKDEAEPDQPIGDPAILRFAGADEKIRFTSSILPKWARRTKSLDALLPVLYLRGAHSRAAGRC
jgi:hypothetical protein